MEWILRSDQLQRVRFSACTASRPATGHAQCGAASCRSNDDIAEEYAIYKRRLLGWREPWHGNDDIAEEYAIYKPHCSWAVL